MEKVSGLQVVTTAGRWLEIPPPAEIQEALGELVGRGCSHPAWVPA